MKRSKQQVEIEKENFLKAYAEKPIIAEACRASGLSKTTFYNLLKKDKEFAKQVEEINKKKCEILEDMMYYYALKGNPTLLIFLACNWMPEKYKNIQKVDITGQHMVTIKIQPFKNDNVKENTVEEKQE